MNPAPVAQLLATLVQAADNNTALTLSDTNETVWNDCFNRIIQTQRPTSVLITLVSRLALTRGYPILDDTILEKFNASDGVIALGLAFYSGLNKEILPALGDELTDLLQTIASLGV